MLACDGEEARQAALREPVSPAGLLLLLLWLLRLLVWLLLSGTHLSVVCGVRVLLVGALKAQCVVVSSIRLPTTNALQTSVGILRYSC